MKLFPLKPMLWAAGASLLTIALGALASAHSLPFSTSIPIFMLLTIVVAWRAGFRASLTVSVVATLGLDFFFTEPRYSLEMTSPREMFALLTFAATSVLVSHLSHRIRVNSDRVAQAEEQQRLLYEFSQSALLINWKESVEEQLCELISRRFRMTGVAIFTTERATVVTTGSVEDAAQRLEASFRALRNYDLPEQAERLRILRFGTRVTGALLLRGTSDSIVADSLATLVATHLERIRSVKSEVSAQSQAVSEKLRTAVLDGLAHAVKTPLTTIIASSSGLREIGPLTPVQSQLADTIEDQARYLAEVTDRLLRTASLDSREIQVQSKATVLREVYDMAVHELRGAHDITRLVSSGEVNVCVLLDPDLLKLVLVQVLENALKYSLAMTPVDVHFITDGRQTGISIKNQGSFIPSEEQGLVFERYYRGAATEHKASGTGIGLSAAKHATEAMGGRIWLESAPETGTTFHISLPIEGD